MPQLAERLFHGKKHAAETAKDFGAGWAVAPAGRCDICSADLDGKHGHRMPAAEFRQLVQEGYNPRARGRLARSLPAGVGAGQWYNAWRKGAMADTTDWGLCEACLRDVAAFLKDVAAYRARMSAPGQDEQPPVDPSMASHMPLSDLMRIFVFTDGDGKAVGTSPMLGWVLRDTAEAPLADFVGRVRLDVIARSDVPVLIHRTGQMPDEAWEAMAALDPVAIGQARKGTYYTVVRPTRDPRSGESFMVVLLYRDAGADAV